MNGYQISFFTTQERRIRHQPVSQWLVELAQSLGIRGATVIAASEGIGRSGRVHSAHFFEQADQPVEIVIVASQLQAAALFASVDREAVQLFYTKIPVEYGVTAVPPANS